MRLLVTAVAAMLLLAPAFAKARKSHGAKRSSHKTYAVARHRPYAPHRAYAPRTGRPSPAIKCIGCVRDSRGRIKRSESAKAAFRRTHPCPSTGRTSGPCPGYAIDHRTPLYKGGSDTPANMQWLSNPAHQSKHRTR